MGKGTKEPKVKKAGAQVIAEAKRAATDPTAFALDFWHEDAEGDDTDDAPIASADGSPRRYAVIEEGRTIHGHYLGCEVLEMPKFGTKGADESEREERAFLVIEVATPKKYPKDAKPYGVLARVPRQQAPVVVPVGEVVFVSVRSRLRPLTMLSGCDFQPLIAIRVEKPSKTARGFNLHNFGWAAWETERPALRVVAQREGSDLYALFGAQDRGLYAARELFGLVIPDRMQAIADSQVTPRAIAAGERKALAQGVKIVSVTEEKRIPANATPAQT
jgi:hypothetical protein